MFRPDQYQLIDFGGGRKLERFGECVLDRPAPVADDVPRAAPELWNAADARYQRQSGATGEWTWHRPRRAAWRVRYGQLSFELKPTDFGHVGLFAEQARNWDWIGDRLATKSNRAARVLNLFAYTGGSTLVAAAAGAEVVHVDAAKNTVHWARRNAANSGFSSAPIRWIVDDARKFVARELRRGRTYDGVILDPPSYAHGPQGQPWKIERDLAPLLQECGELTKHSRHFILLTCHSTGFTRSRLKHLLEDAAPCGTAGHVLTWPLQLRASDGRRLASGETVCWERVES